MDDSTLSTLAQELGEVLIAKGWSCATAESCTGGWVAKALTDIAGSSQWFSGGLVTYTNESKQRLLDVPEAVLMTAGAVSLETVAAMAQGALPAMQCDLAIAISGIAGPGGATVGKPVGTVCFGLADKTLTRAWVEHFDGDREAVRRASVAYALQKMLERLSEPG